MHTHPSTERCMLPHVDHDKFSSHTSFLKSQLNLGEKNTPQIVPLHPNSKTHFQTAKKHPTLKNISNINTIYRHNMNVSLLFSRKMQKIT